MRLMYDSTTANAIPSGAGMVAGYVDGLYAWSDSDWARFPNAVQVRIAVNPATNDGHVLDVEPGNWPASASVDWVLMRRAAGGEPTIYCGTWAPGYTLDDVLAAHDERGVPRPQIWLADYNGLQVIPAGCIAKQYANDAMLGFDADASVVADYWPGVDSAPQPPSEPCAAETQAMASILGRASAIQQELAELVADASGWQIGDAEMIRSIPPDPRSIVDGAIPGKLMVATRPHTVLGILSGVNVPPQVVGFARGIVQAAGIAAIETAINTTGALHLSPQVAVWLPLFVLAGRTLEGLLDGGKQSPQLPGA